MIWNFGNKIQKIVPFLILIILSTNQLQAGTSGNCEKESLAENKELCIDNSEIIKRINHDFQAAYSFGNVASISQPPLIITPDINIEAPSNQKNIEKVYFINTQINHGGINLLRYTFPFDGIVNISQGEPWIVGEKTCSYK